MCKEIIFHQSIPIPRTTALPAAALHNKIQTQMEGAETLAVWADYS